MSHSRRVWMLGGTCFFTVNLLDRRRTLLVDRIELLREAFRVTRAARPFDLIAIVVLPDHLHCIWRLPDGDADNATRWRQIKSLFSRGCEAVEYRSLRRLRKAERGIWQRRYLEHAIRDDDDLRRHVDYMYFNPVKHGHAGRVADWPHSSFRRDVTRGLYPLDWAGVVERRYDGRIGWTAG